MAKRKSRVTLPSLDRKIDQNTADLGRKIADLDRKVDRNTADLGGKIHDLDRKVDRNTADLGRKIHDLDGKVDRNTTDLGRRIDTLDRKADKTLVLVEDLRGDVQKVTEYLVVIDQKWDRRFDNHEIRIVNLEKHAGSS